MKKRNKEPSNILDKNIQHSGRLLSFFTQLDPKLDTNHIPTERPISNFTADLLMTKLMTSLIDEQTQD